MVDAARASDRDLVLTEPAAEFPDAFLIGNGRLGASLYGAPGVERFDLNLDTLWSGGPQEGAADRVGVIERLRVAVAEERHEDADRLARALQGDGWTQSYQPLGRLTWEWGAPEGAENYERRLSFATAQAGVRNGEEWIESFVSAPDGVMVAVSRGSGSGLTFTSPHPVQIEKSFQSGPTRWLFAAGRVPTLVLPNYVNDPEPVRYGAELAGDADTAPAGMGWALAAALTELSDGSRRLIVGAASGFRGYREPVSIDLAALMEEARLSVTEAEQRQTALLRERHRANFGALFDRVGLDLGASGEVATIAQRYFDLGRYLLISSSRPGSQPANLQGIWNVDVRPGWSANFTTNINAQMNYWAAEVLGLPEVHLPFLHFIRDLADAGAVTADSFYGAAGATVHHNSDLWRFSAPVHGDPQWANWQLGLAWLAAHLSDHLDYAGADAEAGAARELALPVLRAAARFVLDQLVEDSDGTLVVSPSTSPEHRFVRAGVTGTVTAGSTMDQELAHQLFGALDALAKDVDAADDTSERAAAALDRLHLPRLDDEGRLEEWRPGYGPSELDHRHLSHLYGAYPGARITPSRDAASFEGVRTALTSRLDHGGGYTGWSQAWVLCLAARLGDAALAEQSLGRLVGDLASRSLLDLHPHPQWPGGMIFQIDGNLGAPAGIAELLVQSHDGAVSLLPTLPAGWPNGSVRGLRTRGGGAVELTWSAGTVASAIVRAGRGEQLVIEWAGAAPPEVTDAAGVVVPSRVDCARAGRSRWAWPAVVGREYAITRAAQPGRD